MQTSIKRINSHKKNAAYQAKMKPIIDKFIEIRRDLLRNVFGETSAEIPEKFNTPVSFPTHLTYHQTSIPHYTRTHSWI
jgi:hypothetical protein